MSAIVVEGLAKRYGRGKATVDALAGVSLSVAQGEIYGLLGRNGAGKTTLVKILLGIVDPTSGAARLAGLSPSVPESRRRVGYLPEDHRLPDYRTAEDLLGYYGMLSGVPTSVLRAEILPWLETVGLAEAAGRKVRSFSKGMKQRLGLAQALLHDPQVLFLDEPTDGVDPVGRAQIRDLLLRLRKEGKTIFLNSHLLSEVEQICDRVGILEEGVLIREGTIEALTRTELLYQIATEPALSDEVRRDVEKIAVSLSGTGGEIEIALREERDIDRIVDLLRGRNVGIRKLASKRFSLEQVFLQAVDEPAGGEE